MDEPLTKLFDRSYA